jgi:hypothetical protein
MNIKREIKTIGSGFLSRILRLTAPIRRSFQRLYSHASLAAALDTRLPASVVVLGKISVYGSRHIRV